MAEQLILCRDARLKHRWKHRSGNNKIDDASEQGYRWRWYAALKAKRRYPGVPITYKETCP